MEQFNPYEIEALLWIQEYVRNDVLDVVMRLLSLINEHGALAMLTVLALVIWKRYRGVGLAAMGSLALDYVIANLILKPTVHRTRPYHYTEELILLGEIPGDFSFPSGHTGTVFAVATVMFLCMPRKYGVTAIVLSALIGISRLYNGAHYPTDVLVGMLLGVACGVLFSLIYRKSCKKTEGTAE